MCNGVPRRLRIAPRRASTGDRRQPASASAKTAGEGRPSRLFASTAPTSWEGASGEVPRDAERVNGPVGTGKSCARAASCVLGPGAERRLPGYGAPEGAHGPEAMWMALNLRTLSRSAMDSGGRRTPAASQHPVSPDIASAMFSSYTVWLDIRRMNISITVHLSSLTHDLCDKWIIYKLFYVHVSVLNRVKTGIRGILRGDAAFGDRYLM